MYVISTENDGFCDTTPQNWTVSLPSGCLYNNLPEVNIGYCPTKLCPGNQTDPNSCRDSALFCCGAVSSNMLSIHCDQGEFKVKSITLCGCVQCDIPYYNIIGRGRSTDGNIPYANGHIYTTEMNLPVNATMNDFGVFDLIVEESTTPRLVLATDNVYNRPTFFDHSHHVLNLPPVTAGRIYYTADVRFPIPEQTLIHLSSSDAILSVNFTDGSSFLQLEMPGNFSYKKSGETFYVSFLM